MDDLRHYAPSSTERGALVGCTGSGKTTLGRELVKLQPYVLALDPKKTLGATDDNPAAYLPGFELVRDPDELPAAARYADRIQFRPDPEHEREGRGWDMWDRVFWWAFDRRNCFLLVDECKLLSRGPIIPDGYRACITSGRERDIGILHCTQRPRGISPLILSESEHYYVFELRNGDDRKRMAEFMPERVAHEVPGRFEFWYQGPGRPLCKKRLAL